MFSPMALLDRVCSGGMVPGMIERLESRCLLSAVPAFSTDVVEPSQAMDAFIYSHDVSSPARLSKVGQSHAKATTINFYAGAGTTTNAISAATAGGTLAPSAPANVPQPVTPAPLATTFTTPDSLGGNSAAEGVADLTLTGTIADNAIVIGTNSNVANIYNFATGGGIISVTNSNTTDTTFSGMMSIFAF